MPRRRVLAKLTPIAMPPASDIVLFDNQENKEVVIPGLSYNLANYPKDRFTPIGVVVIPKDHSKVIYPEGHACYNKPVMMSLKYMDYDKPDEGGALQSICWGGLNADLSLQNYKKSAVVANSEAEETSTESSDSYSYIPSTNFSKSYPESKSAPKTYYYTNDVNPPCPSPFLFKDGIWGPNPAYYNCPVTCVQRDRDGKGNTTVILEAVSVTDWKTASAIANSYSTGNYPAACCCWRFHTIADNQGDWYLPAAGELGYIMPFFNQHNNAISRINQVYRGSSFATPLYSNVYHWSSSEYGRDNAYCVATGSGTLKTDGYKNYGYSVRAFRPVSV